MATHGKLVIFRMTDTTDTEDTITDDKVEFDGDAQVPDEKSGVISFAPVLSRTQTENPAPFQEISRKPDTGFAGIRYTLQLFFDESDGEAEGIQRIRNWYREENATSDFREGLFGIRNDYRPEFDLTPSSNAGYKLIHFELNQELLHSKLVRATLILEFSGDPAKLGA